MTEFSLSLVPVEYICSNVHERLFSYDELYGFSYFVVLLNSDCFIIPEDSVRIPIVS